ncbi:Mitogen-activated protein kinase kinase kinase [Parasponia andersonii]|uniref:Mitogen-activated protein kinase kinase kinase n=1 Tax=Parasponia andersonii TaxID=3476 RepID=A0A2P5AFN7_PARAD|nr:Mitogen-activated protein kinase kinase kinase [Parasponia andersonii]
MEKCQNHRTYIPLSPLFIFFLRFSSLHLISSAYDIPDKDFINCGSKENVNNGTRNFTGDENSGSFTKPSSTVSDSNQSPNTSTLYHTARIFREQSSYRFETEVGTTYGYLVRLHFFAFSSQPDLSTAVFDVSASGSLLLHNFTASKDLPLIKEFFLTTNTRKFRIYFTPKESSLAFVNAIEVFPAPPLNFSLNESQRAGGSFKFPPTSVLQTIYRINVGGITISGDQIWRNWETDDSYLYAKDGATNNQSSDELHYQSEDGKYDAPDMVYRTAKLMSNTNVTWGFNVNKTAEHLVRAHFCDFISISPNVLSFNLYINDNFRQEINYSNYLNKQTAPFHIDFVVGSYDSDVMNISIGHTNPRFGDHPFLNGLEILEIVDALAAIPTEYEQRQVNIPIVLGSLLGGFALLSILVAALFVFLKRPRANPVEKSIRGQVPAYGGRSSHGKSTSSSPVPNLNLGLKISFAEIKSATKNFNPRQLIGRGGFGTVYKGTLSDGTKVAVKRGAPGSGQGFTEFQTEIMVLSKIRHQHLVPLIGYCDERSEMILVYEFMEQGTLTDHLYNADLPRLSWKQRLQICIGAARGLRYLHMDSSEVIIHRDVKSTNILLDQNLVAKVADFGLSKSGPPDETHISTKVRGTFGYLDPEYFKSQLLTEKSDVYSFGVVLLEVLCARPAIDNLLPRDQMNLAEWAMRCKRKGVIEQIVDPSIKGQINPKSLKKFAETAEKCLQEDGSERPAMSDVIWDLEYALQLQQTTVPREDYEDSTVMASSSAFEVDEVRRLPSLGSTVGDVCDEFSELTLSEVFSQMRDENAAR